MDRYIGDMTLREIKDMCKKTHCDKCKLHRKKNFNYNEDCCYLLLYDPSQWHGKILNQKKEI